MYFIKMVHFRTAMKNIILITKNWGGILYSVPPHPKSWGVPPVSAAHGCGLYGGPRYGYSVTLHITMVY